MAARMCVATWVATVLMVAGSGASARADHLDRCGGIHGEGAMIQALHAIQAARVAPCERTREDAADRAIDFVDDAIDDVCSRDSRKTLQGAIRSLHRFIGTGQFCHLNEATERVHRSLQYERIAHATPAGRGGGRVLPYDPGYSVPSYSDPGYGYPDVGGYGNPTRVGPRMEVQRWPTPQPMPYGASRGLRIGVSF